MFWRRERRRAIPDDPRESQGRSPSGYLSTRAQITKLYAIDGTDFYDSLGDCPAPKTGSSTYEVLGIFTVDPLSVVKVLDRIAKDNTLDGEWIEVPFPSCTSFSARCRPTEWSNLL